MSNPSRRPVADRQDGIKSRDRAGAAVRQSIASRPDEIERRALVGFACILVLLQALLATLAWPLPRTHAGAFAICHAGGATSETGAPDPAEKQPNIPCAL